MRKTGFLLPFLVLFLVGCAPAQAADPCTEYGFCPEQLVDPGTGPWVTIPASEIEEVCRLDPDLLREVELPENGSFAIVRYGRLCYVSGEDGSHGTGVSHVFSATKTLGALLVGAVSYSSRHLPASEDSRSGPLGEYDRIDKWIDLADLPESARIHPDATIAHVLAMVAQNEDLSHGQKTYQYDTTGSREINHLIRVIDAVVQQDPERLGGNAVEAKDRLFAKLGLEHSTWAATLFGYSWNSSLLDMARVGLLILNGGIYNGERLVDSQYVYNLTHPAFEDASTRYGYSTWVNNISCTPQAVHRSYPQGLSGALECQTGDCDQEYDVGVWNAAGAGGQYIIGHRGLDMIVVGKNWATGGGNRLWQAVLPAVVAADPVFRGDQEEFCAAYSAGSYAPDLRNWEGGL